jgi:predicted phosphodiesterase
MRVLALSDVHNNVPCVRKLRAQEENAFDVIVVAGDIGSDRANEIFGVLRTFECPIVYVYGNWDHKLTYDEDFGLDAHLLHLNSIRVGSIRFTGFSEFRHERDPQPMATAEDRGEYYRRRAEFLSRELSLSNVDLGRTVLVTHERVTRLGERFPGLLMHVFGHIHAFDLFDRKGCLHVNVSALDRMLPVLPRASSRVVKGLTLNENFHEFEGSLRYVNAGNYAVIEVDASGRTNVECRFFQHAYEDWRAVYNDTRLFGGPLVPEETVFGNNERFTRLSQ